MTATVSNAPDRNAPIVRDSYFQVGRAEPGYPAGYKHAIVADGMRTVVDAVGEALRFRLMRKRTAERMWLAVFVRGDDGINRRFTATFEPNQSEPKWELSG